MRGTVALVTLLLLPALIGGASGEVCGRIDYPSADAYLESSVVDAARWQTFLDQGGFEGAQQGEGSVEILVAGPGGTFRVRVEEVRVREYVGGSFSDTTLLALRVAEESPGTGVATHNFTYVSTGGRAGGTITVAARPQAGGVSVVWRWAYLPCGEGVVNAYYVFEGRVANGQVVDDNVLLYFEAPRPRGSPPADLILLIAAGVAVSVIFLLARRALKREP